MKNFLSVGAVTQAVDLGRNGLTLVLGDNLDLGGTFLEADELREMYEGLLNGRKPEEVIHMCGSGVTACHNLLAMEIAISEAFRSIALYVGAIFLLIALFFVWRSFYGMRTPTKE